MIVFFRTIVSSIASFLLALIPLQSYTEGVVGQPQTFIPSNVVSHNERTISQLIYRGLFKYDIYGVLIPDLAEMWTLSDEGLVYTIKLKEKQYWSNGQEINADDLIYTAYKIPDLKGVATDKVDDYTVRYTLPNRYAPFLNLLTVSILPNNTDEERSLKPITSDDFKVGRVERNGAIIKKVVLVTQKSEYPIRKIIFRYYTNEEELSNAAQLGEIDGFMSQNIHEELENYENYRFPLQGIYFALYFNMRNEKFEDVELRKKLEKVLPIKQMIVNEGISVQGAISRGLFTDMELEYDNYDPEFEEDLGELPITLTVPDIDKHVRIAKVVKDIWEDRLEVSVVIRKIPPDELMSKVIEPRDFELLLFGQEVSRDPDRYVIWHSTQVNYPGLNITGFNHVRADRALEEGRNELHNDYRTVHYKEFQRVLQEQTPIIFLYHPYQNFYVSNYIKGVGEKYTFTPVDRFLDFSNWERVKTN
ncbi:ABC transporter substrate-binding protein [Patescibacteria group bacterium]|nr:ABC transporter substrate-binding protein [Patescibacteria group bacterium]